MAVTDLPARLSRATLVSLCGLALVLAACGEVSPSEHAVVTPGPTPTPLANGSASPLPSVELPGQIDAQAMNQHLVALDEIANENDGVRTAGTPGYEASVEYAIVQFQSFGYEVTTPTFQMPTYRELPGSTIDVEGGPSFSAPDDFHAMIFSGGGDVTARVASVGFPDSAGGEGDQGCSPGDWAEFPSGAIAVTPPGHCFRRDETLLAQDAGAVALVVAYDSWGPGEARRPTLIQPDDLRIPSISAIGAVGEALLEAADIGIPVHVAVQTEIGSATVRNVIAASSGSDGESVAMIGAHLDSVLDGPGINDDGSGVAAVLEIARLLAGSEAGATLRFALWAGEEFGLYGSRDYVLGLSSANRSAISGYLNADMLGSPNGVPYVYRNVGSAAGSSAIGDYLVAWLRANGDGAEFEDLGGGSDHYFFEEAGIRTGGIFSGATELKTAAQAATYGGQADEPMDACYHLICDTADNVNLEHAALYTTALANAMLLIAHGDL